MSQHPQRMDTPPHKWCGCIERSSKRANTASPMTTIRTKFIALCALLATGLASAQPKAMDLFVVSEFVSLLQASLDECQGALRLVILSAELKQLDPRNPLAQTLPSKLEALSACPQRAHGNLTVSWSDTVQPRLSNLSAPCSASLDALLVDSLAYFQTFSRAGSESFAVMQVRTSRDGQALRTQAAKTRVHCQR